MRNSCVTLKLFTRFSLPVHEIFLRIFGRFRLRTLAATCPARVAYPIRTIFGNWRGAAFLHDRRTRRFIRVTITGVTGNVGDTCRKEKNSALHRVRRVCELREARIRATHASAYKKPPTAARVTLRRNYITRLHGTHIVRELV